MTGHLGWIAYAQIAQGDPDKRFDHGVVVGFWWAVEGYLAKRQESPKAPVLLGGNVIPFPLVRR